MKPCKPTQESGSANEQQVAATFQYQTMMNGADGLAYDSIAASGQNACILHYTENNQIIEPRKCLLLDAGCSVGHYAGDVIERTQISKSSQVNKLPFMMWFYMPIKHAFKSSKPGVSMMAIQEKKSRSTA